MPADKRAQHKDDEERDDEVPQQAEVLGVEHFVDQSARQVRLHHLQAAAGKEQRDGDAACFQYGLTYVRMRRRSWDFSRQLGQAEPFSTPPQLGQRLPA